MKKTLSCIFLVLCNIIFAQSLPITTANNIKITNPVQGYKSDSVLVWRGSSDKLVRWVKSSELVKKVIIENSIKNKPYYYPSWYTGIRIPVSIENGKAKYDYDVSSNFILSNYTPYFVSPTGVDTNDGLSELTPKKSVLSTFNSGGRLIYMMSGTYYRDTFVGSGLNIGNTDLLIIGLGEVNVSTGHEGLSWVLSTSNTYRATRSTVTNVFDYGFLNKYGFKSSLKRVLSQALCEAEPGTYFTDNIGVWVHTSDNRIPDSNIVVPVGLSNSIIGTQGRIYIENISLYGIELYINGTNSTSTIEVYMKNVKVPYAQKPTIVGSQEYNSFRVNNIKKAIFQKCIGVESTQDIFNYHNTGGVLNSVCAELDCTAYSAGVGSVSDNNQASSIHEGMKILRLNGNYYGGNTQTIADVASGSQTVMVGCELNTGSEQPNTVIFYGVNADLEACKLFGNKQIVSENTSVEGVNIRNSILNYSTTIGNVTITQ